MADAEPPPGWSADVVLSDGGTVHLRPIRPADADRVVALHSRFSERTRYLRYFGAYPRIPARDLTRFVTVDGVDRVALVAELGADLIAIGRYDRLPGTDDDAEVAFVVEDAHQGRGLGPVLLEHLAAAGRQRHVKRFVAEILPDNRTMVRVFLDAGYSTEHRYADGVVRLSFPIAETDESVDVSRRREHSTEARSVGRLLAPRSVVVAGASPRSGTLGRAVLASLVEGGFAGRLAVVSPSGADVGGVPGFVRVVDVGAPVDLVVVAVPAAAVLDVVADCAIAGVHGLVVLSAGFAETGEQGAAAQRALVSTARGSGMRIVGPNALGIASTSPYVRLNATFAPVLPAAGPVGFFCQSGALGVATLEAMARRGVGLSSFVSAGNRADVSGNDLLQYWEDDDRTGVVLLHLESFGNPRKFSRLARRVAQRKPVVALKSGGTRGLADVPLSEEALQALFAASGVIRVRTLPELLDVAQLLAYQPLPVGERVGVVTNSAALGVLAADACSEAGLPLAPQGVVDVGPTAPAADFVAALAAAIDDDTVDAVVAVFVPPLSGGSPDVSAEMAEVAQGSHKPVVSTFYGITGVPSGLRRDGEDGTVLPGSVPSYPSPELAVQALARVAGYARWRHRPVGSLPELADVDPAAARTVVTAALTGIDSPEDDTAPVQPTERELSPAAGRELLAAYGVAVLPSELARSAEESVAAADRAGYPVVLKSQRVGLQHRVDLGGVRLDLADAEDVASAYAQLATLGGAGPADVLVQPMAPPGVAVVVAMTDDPSFGALVQLAVAGVPAELLADIAYRPLPLTDLDARELVRAPRASPLLFGHRGAEPTDVAALEDLLLRVGRLAEDLPEICSLRLDPVLVGARGVHCLAAQIGVRAAVERPDTGPRRLR